MKITLIAVGKTDNAHLQALIADYVDRLCHYTNFSFISIPDIKNTKNLSQDEQKRLEGEQILKQVADNGMLILLDERGKEYRSVDFAQMLNKWQTHSVNLYFVIGGPYGFSQEVYSKSSMLLSLSKATFSHQMIRLIFVEQLYRAFTILHNQPYHHE